MSKSTWVSRVARPRQIRRPDPSKVIVSTTRQTAGEWRFSPPGGSAGWYMAVTVDIDVDPGVTGDVRLRTAAGVASTPIVIATTTRQLRLGWTFITQAGTRVFLEVRRTGGSGGLKVLKANGMAMSSPPDADIDGDDPGGGGTTTASDVRGAWVSANEAASHNILPADISPAPQPGDKILLIGAAAGPSDVTTFTWNFPGAPVPVQGGGNLVHNSTGYFPRAIGTVVDYAGGTTGWTVAGSSNFRAAAVALSSTVGLIAGTPSQGFSPVDPLGVNNAADAVGLAINIINFSGASVTTPAAGHTTVIASPVGSRQIHIAKIPVLTAGTYNPAAAATGPGSEESTVFAIVAQPTATGAAVGAPTVPTFNSAGAITLALTDNIAAVVAGYPANTHFQLLNGTYTDWNDVRPKTGMYFKGPAAGTAVLEGTSKGYAFRAIDATGSSNNVTISTNIKIQNYGLGTSRAEYGAIQAQPTDTIGNQYTYGTATGWYVHDVELALNSSNGIRMSDNGTVDSCLIYGHSVTGIGADRNVGGLIYGNTLEANGYESAPGAGANGANIKVTFINGHEGRTSIVPLAAQRTPATFQVANNTFNATRAGITGTTNIGFWADLDCELVDVTGNTFSNHPWCGIMFEGCNNVSATSNQVTNSDGYGNCLGEDFILGAITVAETTNCMILGNTITNSVRALVNRQSNRSADWFNSNNSSFVNFSWPTSQGGVRYWIDATGPLPVPAPSARANQWSGETTFQANVLNGCDRVYINEGTNGGGMVTQGSTPVSKIYFVANSYAGSPNIVAGGFYDRSNTGISLAAWRSIALARDQP